MDTMYTLCEKMARNYRNYFKFQYTQEKMIECENTLIKANCYTNSGKRRYPVYVSVALRMVADTWRKQLANENLIFCYVIDGVLYTTYNRKTPNKYYFTGQTNIPNYREVGKEQILIELQRKGVEITSGFYYPNGKPYFVTTK